MNTGRGLDREVGYQTKFFCSGVSFPEIKLEFNKPGNIRDFFLEDYTPPTEVTIDWVERSDWAIRRYHQEWFDLFWDRRQYRFISSGADTPDRTTDRYRTARITVYNSIGETTGFLELYDLLPMNIPQLSLSFESSEALKYSISYKVGDWDFYFPTSPFPPSDIAVLNKVGIS